MSTWAVRWELGGQSKGSNLQAVSLSWHSAHRRPVSLSPLRKSLGGHLFCYNSELFTHFLVEQTQAKSSDHSADKASLTSIPSFVDIATPPQRASCVIPFPDDETEGSCGSFAGWNLPLTADSQDIALWVCISSTHLPGGYLPSEAGSYDSTLMMVSLNPWKRSKW